MLCRVSISWHSLNVDRCNETVFHSIWMRTCHFVPETFSFCPYFFINIRFILIKWYLNVYGFNCPVKYCPDLCVWLQTGYGLVNGFIDHLYTRLGITASSLISTFHKSPQHPLIRSPVCCVFNSRSVATASNWRFFSFLRSRRYWPGEYSATEPITSL
jgi:hypothetical protein